MRAAKKKKKKRETERQRRIYICKKWNVEDIEMFDSDPYH